MMQDFTGGTQVLGDLLFAIRVHLHDLMSRGRHRVDGVETVGMFLDTLRERVEIDQQAFNEAEERKRVRLKKNLASCLIKGHCPEGRLSIEGKTYYVDRTYCDWRDESGS